MGGPVGSNETCDSTVSHYLYGKIIQETHFSHYGADLATAGLVITVVYSTPVDPGDFVSTMVRRGQFSSITAFLINPRLKLVKLLR